MITNINTQKLYKLMEAFYNLTGIKVAIYSTDFEEVFSYPKADSEFCTFLHTNDECVKSCSKSSEMLCRNCEKENMLIIGKCHAGLTEAVKPLSNGVFVQGYIMFGQITNNKDRKRFNETLLKSCEKFGFLREDILKHGENIKYYSDSKIEDASEIINALASYIVLENLIYTSENTMIKDIKKFIDENLSENLSISDLCKSFSVSKSELYKVLKPYMPDGIAGYIRKTRIKKASELALCSNMPVWQVAESVGFSDCEYFLRVFKKEKGISFGRYRNGKMNI